MDTTKDKLPETEKDIDIIAIARYLWSKRKLLLKSSAIAVLVALIVAFSIPKEYTTTVKLMPETNNPANKMGNPGRIGSYSRSRPGEWNQPGCHIAGTISRCSS